MDAIRTTGLTKTYKDTIAVDHLDLTVKQGELFSLLGTNGAGKTTTIRMLTCLTQPTDGDAFLNEKSICTDTAAVKSIIAYSPQETAVAPNLTVEENLALMAGVCEASGYQSSQKDSNDRSVNRRQRRQDSQTQIHDLMNRLGLEPVAKKRAGKLSGGWQRRLSIAMALICEPEILFLDEPTLGLDVIARSELWDLIRSLKGKITIILTTHYMEEAESLSDRIAILKGGRLLLTGTAQELMAHAGTDRFEDAFIRIVKEQEVIPCEH